MPLSRASLDRTPSTVTEPPVGSMMSPMIFNRVLLPQPLGPMIETNSLPGTEKEIRSRALTSPLADLNVLLIFGGVFHSAQGRSDEAQHDVRLRFDRVVYREDRVSLSNDAVIGGTDNIYLDSFRGKIQTSGYREGPLRVDLASDQLVVIES